jgi:regulator of RNase E activity RraA
MSRSSSAVIIIMGTSRVRGCARSARTSDESVHPRHLVVGDEDVEVVVAAPGLRLERVVERLHVHGPHLLDQRAQQRQPEGVVVDDDDGLCRSAGAPGAR